MRPSRWATLVELNAPLAQWASSDLASEDPTWLAAGSPWWHLAYITVLCGAAATAAMLHEAVAGRRTRLLRRSGGSGGRGPVSGSGLPRLAGDLAVRAGRPR
jgi:hypothetical protein